MKQLLLDIKPDALPSLQNFVIGRNAEALNSLKALQNIALQNISLKNMSAQPKFIYFWGNKGSGKSHLLQACKALNITVVDDVHLLNNESQIDLFNQYNQLKEAGKPFVTAGNNSPSQMNLRGDLATRLAWGLVYQLQPLNDAEKALALNNHAIERGMRLPIEVLDYCLRYLRRDLPTLMATLDALDVWSLTMQKPITVLMLRKLLQLNLEL